MDTEKQHRQLHCALPPIHFVNFILEEKSILFKGAKPGFHIFVRFHKERHLVRVPLSEIHKILHHAVFSQNLLQQLSPATPIGLAGILSPAGALTLPQLVGRL